MEDEEEVVVDLEGVGVVDLAKVVDMEEEVLEEKEGAHSGAGNMEEVDLVAE